MKNLKYFKQFESHTTRDNFNPEEPIHLPHSDNVYGYSDPGEGNGTVIDEEYSSIMVPMLCSDDVKTSHRWSTYNAVKIAFDYWDAISDEEWVEINDEFMQRVVDNKENPALAIVKLFRRYDNLDVELLRLKTKIEGYVKEDEDEKKGFVGRWKDRLGFSDKTS